jgi:hypothetical protein
MFTLHIKNLVASSLTLLCILTTNGWCAEHTMRVVSFDMPHGGCRLSVNSDGSGTLAYGALPSVIRIKQGTFDADALIRELRAIATPQTDDINTRLPGSIQFGSAETLLWFSDKELARINFQKALSNMEPPRPIDAYATDRLGMVENTCRNL